jgi:hypothetical protein
MSGTLDREGRGGIFAAARPIVDGSAPTENFAKGLLQELVTSTKKNGQRVQKIHLPEKSDRGTH